MLDGVPLPQQGLHLGDGFAQGLRTGGQLGVGVALAHLQKGLGVAAPVAVALQKQGAQRLGDGALLVLGYPALGGQLRRRALHHPAAAGFLKADDPLLLLDVAAREDEAGLVVHAAALVQHDGEIRRAHDACGAVDVIKAVVQAFGFAGVVDQEHADAPAVRKLLELAHVGVVGVVGVLKGLALGLDLGEGVDAHEVDVRVLVEEGPQPVQQSFVQAGGRELDVEVLRQRPPGGQLAQAGLHPALAVLQRKVQRPVGAGGAAQKRLAPGGGQAEVQHHPALADLGLGHQHAHPHGQHPLHDVPQRRQQHLAQLGGGVNVGVRAAGRGLLRGGSGPGFVPCEIRFVFHIHPLGKVLFAQLGELGGNVVSPTAQFQVQPVPELELGGPVLHHLVAMILLLVLAPEGHPEAQPGEQLLLTVGVVQPPHEHGVVPSKILEDKHVVLHGSCNVGHSKTPFCTKPLRHR